MINQCPRSIKGRTVRKAVALCKTANKGASWDADHAAKSTLITGTISDPKHGILVIGSHFDAFYEHRKVMVCYKECCGAESLNEAAKPTEAANR